MSKSDWSILPNSVPANSYWIVASDDQIRAVVDWMKATLLEPQWEAYTTGHAFCVGFSNVADEALFALRWPQYYSKTRSNIVTTLVKSVGL